MSQPVSSFQGDNLYLDTMVFYSVLRASSTVARALLKQIETGRFQAYTAVLTFDELAYRMLLTLIRDKYGKSPQDHLRQDQAGVIAEFYPQIEQQLNQLQLLPNLTILDITLVDLIAMHRNSLAHHLLPRDALHLATMQKVGCKTLVSLDSDFDSIPGIHRYTLD
jgi:predicted nucleic acid-binding protein